LNRSEDDHRLLPKFRRNGCNDRPETSANQNGNGKRKVIATAGGDPLELRMVPVIGAYASVIPGSKPDSALIAKEKRESRLKP
jgi:hypothetical protein